MPTLDVAPPTTESPRRDELGKDGMTAPYVVVLLMLVLWTYSFYLGILFICARYSGGRVHGGSRVHGIRTEYTRQRTAPQGSDVTTAHGGPGDTSPRRGIDYLSRRMAYPRPALNENDVDDPGDTSPRRGIDYLSRRMAFLRPALNNNDVDDPEESRQIQEDRRISRLPAFVQGDRGDAYEFPGIPYGIPMQVFHQRFDVDYSHLGLHQAGGDEWLVVDRHFDHHACARTNLLDSKLTECIQNIPAGNRQDPSEELMPEVATYLTTKFPLQFEEDEQLGYRHIHNLTTGEIWTVRYPYSPEALEMLARLCNEDFVFFSRDPCTSRWQLFGGAVCFPSGWSLKALVGDNVEQLEETVLSWNSKSTLYAKCDDGLTLSLDMTAILDCMEQVPDRRQLKRSTTFLQTDPGNRQLHDLLFIQAPQDFFPGNLRTLNWREMIVRKETQIFRKLAQSECIVMTVKTELRYLRDLDPKECADLAAEIRSWPREMAIQKGRGLWKRAVLGYLSKKAGVHQEGMVMKAGEDTDEDSD